MKKKSFALFLAACMLTLTACGGQSTIATGNKKLADAVYDDDYISLAAYTGLKAEKKIYEVTKEALDDAIHDKVSSFADYKSVNRASADTDWVSTNFTASADGEAIVSEDNYTFILGDEEYGSEFDEKLTGVSAGDELTFTLNFDDDFADSDFAGKAIDFDITVKDVQEEILPELTDEFIKEHFDYDSYDAFADAERETIADTYEAESTSELQETLLSQVVDASSILQYTKKDYDAAYEDTKSFYTSYAEMFGTDVDSLYESFGMTKDDLKSEALDTLYKTMVINAIAKNEGLSLSDEDYDDGVVYYMEQNDYDSKDEFIKDYGEDEIRRQLSEDQVLNFLVNHADITEIKAEYSND